jgi:hypothetical protein
LKLIVAFAAVAVLTAGPALAQSSYGIRPAPGSGSGSTYHPPSNGSAPTQKIYGASQPPKAQGFKPYEPYKPSSTYASPKTPSYGAKPCETSVYTNACDKRR